jgi:excisionase family DNA binding protein
LTPDNSVSRRARSLRTHVVARRLKVSPRTVRHWAEKGLIPAQRAGIRPWTFDEADVDKFSTDHGYPKREA